MKTFNLTEGQKRFLYESLRDQKSEKNTPEKILFSELREYFAEVIEVGPHKLLSIDGYVKQIEMDTFGEDYRFGWIKVNDTSKGRYFYSSYHGKRIYL